MMRCLGERNPNRVLNSQKDQTNGYETPQQENIHEYAKKLQKENLRLTRALAEKSKLLKLSCTENQKLRMNLRDLKKKNLQFAKSNCQILAQHKADRDRLKAEHELRCKNVLETSQTEDDGGENGIGGNAINKKSLLLVFISSLLVTMLSTRSTMFDLQETTRVSSRRDFTVFDFHEEESVGSISEAVEAPSQSSHEISEKRRVSTRRQATKDKSQTDNEAIKEIMKDPSLRKWKTQLQEKAMKLPLKKHDHTEKDHKKESKAEKLQSYKEAE